VLVDEIEMALQSRAPNLNNLVSLSQKSNEINEAIVEIRVQINLQ
jgi:hypothetical protein